MISRCSRFRSREISCWRRWQYFAAILSLICLTGSVYLTAAEKKVASKLSAPGDHGLIPNGKFDLLSNDGAPAGFELTGDVTFGPLGDKKTEHIGKGAKLLAGTDKNKDGAAEGSLSTKVEGLRPENGRWFRLSIRALAQESFRVASNELYLKVEFFRDGGTNPLDLVKKSIFPDVERNLRDLTDVGTNKHLGRATWRTYDLDFHTPFPEVDSLKVTAGFSQGKAGEFWINEVTLTPIPVPADYTPPQNNRVTRGKAAISEMVSLGGRWYYDPQGATGPAPQEFNHKNDDRLFYLSDRLEAPFVDNMSAWLRKGSLDSSGKEVRTDRFVPDNLTVSFTKTHLVMHSKNVPNHPTSVFPDNARFLDGNPNYLKEFESSWSIPLEPKENPEHIAMKEGNNENQALNRGPIGVAVNGIVFFNPFDMDAVDALFRLDRCCGHPSPNYMYHYHKYPVCVKSPWADDGTAHSPLIGFAFDGFPVYGPYESEGVLAKNTGENPLNEFNVHFDEERGWHYHVTPGSFPHVIGGYWGAMDASNRRGPPGMAGRGPGGPGPGGPGGGPPGPGGRGGPPPNGAGPPGPGGPGPGGPGPGGPRPGGRPRRGPGGPGGPPQGPPPNDAPKNNSGNNTGGF